MWDKVELKKRSVFGRGAGGWREEANLQGAVTGRGKSASRKRVIRAAAAQSNNDRYQKFNKPTSTAQCPSGLRGVIRTWILNDHLCIACVGSNPACVDSLFARLNAFSHPFSPRSIWIEVQMACGSSSLDGYTSDVKHDLVIVEAVFMPYPGYNLDFGVVCPSCSHSIAIPTFPKCLAFH
jgi:hypothetical protein